MSESPALEARLRGAICSVSGVEITNVTFETRFQTVANKAYKIHILSWGWAPSLHLVQMIWTEEFDAPSIPPEKAWIDAVVERFKNRIEIQRRHLERGIKAGVAEPMAVDRIDHLSIDRDLVEMLKAEHEKAEHPIGLVRQTLVDDVELVLKSGYSGIDDTMRTTAPWKNAVLKGTMLYSEHKLRKGISFDGRHVRVKQEIPETLIAAAAGRTLRSVIDLPESIRDRIITSGGHEDGKTWFRTMSKPVLVRDALPNPEGRYK